MKLQKEIQTMKMYKNPILYIKDYYELEYQICTASYGYELPTDGKTEDLEEEY